MRFREKSTFFSPNSFPGTVFPSVSKAAAGPLSPGVLPQEWTLPWSPAPPALPPCRNPALLRAWTSLSLSATSSVCFTDDRFSSKLCFLPACFCTSLEHHFKNGSPQEVFTSWMVALYPCSGFLDDDFSGTSCNCFVTAVFLLCSETISVLLLHPRTQHHVYTR